jgi:hypothetical protein
MVDIIDFYRAKLETLRQMRELWISYRDEDGYDMRVRVDRDKFVIGRHSSADLVIADNRLSREHLVIERLGNDFVVSDPGSSNGSDLNGAPLVDPVMISSGDVVNLGGAIDARFEIRDDAPTAAAETPISPAAVVHPAAAKAESTSNPAPATGPGGFPVGLLILGPLAAILLLIIGVGLVLLFSGGTPADDTDKNLRVERRTSDDDDDKPTPEKTTTPSPSSSPIGTTTTMPTNGSTPPPANLTENAKLEQNAAAFLRRIAQNDPTAFLTAEQAQKVSSRVKQFSGSSALADNINSARKNAAALKTLASSKNLKPQFLATAALAKLGSGRGDVVQVAQSMAGIFEKLNTQIGSERSDDSLLMIAAYDQGEKGDFMRLRNMLQDLATKFPESARSIRSIWFLQKQNKISTDEFEFALRFIAIGTITQSPKDFGVSAEPLTL